MEIDKSKIIKLAERWIQKNNDDFKSAQIEFKESKNYTLICFLCQQIVERYLKICLMLFNGDFPKIHNLLDLLQLVAEYQPNILDYDEECHFLNQFYLEMRYPVFWGQPTEKQDAKQAIGHTESLIKFIHKLIKSKTNNLLCQS